MEIVPYHTKYKQNFIDLNLAWIKKYFKVEPQDVEILNSIEQIIAAGAMIYFALEADKVVATCMVMPKNDQVWEICKLAADENYQGRGAGAAVLKACMNYAKNRGAKKLLIVTNTILSAAMHLYEKVGFREVPIDEMGYERVDIQLEKIL